MYVTGVGSVTTMRIAGYQAQALQAVDKSSARLAANRSFTSFAEDSVAATREISLRAQQGAAGAYLRATQDAAAAADAAAAGLQTASDILVELRTAVLALDTLDPDSVTAAQQTITQLTGELTRIGATTTTVGGKNLLDGSIASTPLSFTVAASGSASDQVDLTAIAVNAAQLGSASLKLNAIDFTAGAPTTQSDALAAIDAARSAVAASLASTAAVSSAMTHHTTAVTSQVSAIDTALDNLVGVDVAQETLALTQNRIRAEAAAAMLSQVNALHVSMVRQLLMGQ
jgi:flagellin-like hook-associated protein FlgL